MGYLSHCVKLYFQHRQKIWAAFRTVMQPSCIRYQVTQWCGKLGVNVASAKLVGQRHNYLPATEVFPCLGGDNSFIPPGREEQQPRWAHIRGVFSRSPWRVVPQSFFSEFQFDQAGAPIDLVNCRADPRISRGRPEGHSRQQLELLQKGCRTVGVMDQRSRRASKSFRFGESALIERLSGCSQEIHLLKQVLPKLFSGWLRHVTPRFQHIFPVLKVSP